MDISSYDFQALRLVLFSELSGPIRDAFENLPTSKVCGDHGVGSKTTMDRGTRPGVVFGAPHDAGANGIELDIANAEPQVRIVERAGEKSSLP